MSLDELLKDSGNNSLWRDQQKKLFRIIAGLFVVVFAIIAFHFLVLAPKSKNSEEVVDVGEEEETAQALARLLEIREDAKRLKAEVDRKKMQRAPQTVEPPKKRAAPPVVTRDTHRSLPPILGHQPSEGFSSLQESDEDLYIPTGSVFQGRLLTPIKTSVERTFVMAEVTNEYRMDMDRRIPKGSRLIGRSRLNPILKGVIVEFETLVLPDGTETQLSSLALSRDALPEIDGLYFSNRLETYGTALAFGFLSGMADAGRRRSGTLIGEVVEDSLSNQVLAGLSTASFQVAEDLLRDINNRSVEYVVVPAGEPIFVVLTRRYTMTAGRR